MVFMKETHSLVIQNKHSKENTTLMYPIVPNGKQKRPTFTYFYKLQFIWPPMDLGVHYKFRMEHNAL